MLANGYSRAKRYLTSEGLGPFLVRALAGTGAVRIGSVIASFAVGVQLARGLGVEGYGYYSLALSVITIAGIPGEMGLPRLVTREVARAFATDNPPHLFGVLRWGDRMAMRLSLAMAVGVIGAALILVRTRPSGLGLSLLLGAPIIPLMALSRIRGGALQGLRQIVRGQIPANLLRPVVLSVLLFAVFLAGTRLVAPMAMALNAFAAAAAFVVAHFWLRRRLPQPPAAYEPPTGRGWLASSIPMALTDGMRVLQIEASIFLLGIFAPATQVGLFRIASSTAMIAASVMIMVNHVAMPTMAHLHAQGDRGRLQKLMGGSVAAQFAGVSLLCVPLLLFPSQLLTFAFGSGYAPAATALRILAAGQMVNSAFGSNVALLNMTGRERRVTRAMAIGLAVNLIGVVVFGVLWGINGVAVAVVGGLLCWNMLVSIDARRLLGIETTVLVLRRKMFTNA